MVTRLSEEERKGLIERFHQSVSEGIPSEQKWLRQKVEANAPRLPADPSPEQLDAWVELSEMIRDPSFIESMRDNAREVWTQKLDLDRLQRLNVAVGEAGLAAQSAGTAPESAGGRALIERYLAGLAELSGQRADDPAFRGGVRQYFDRQDPRKTRYWQLVSILRGEAALSTQVAGWGFVVQALRHHLPSSAS